MYAKFVIKQNVMRALRLSIRFGVVRLPLSFFLLYANCWPACTLFNKLQKNFNHKLPHAKADHKLGKKSKTDFK